MRSKYYEFVNLIKPKEGEAGQLPHLYKMLYEKTKLKNKPIILELGTHKGMSTLMFLKAVEEVGGHVFSVDIDNKYHDLFESNDWTFIHSDSTDVNGILQKFPKLKGGIDILLIDSLHTKKHVEKEFWLWEPYFKKDALIVFDDIDNHIYRQGARKDFVFHEFDWCEIHDYVKEIFFANEDNLFLEMHYGSTGFAYLTKRNENKLTKPIKAVKRTDSIFWSTYVKLRKFIKR